MARIAGNDPDYTFRLCRVIERESKTVAEKLAGPTVRELIPTEHGFGMPSVTTFQGDVMGKPAGAMAWWGFRIGLDGIAKALADDVTAVIDAGADGDTLEALLKERNVNPNVRTEEAGDRGSKAHGILELLAEGENEAAEAAAVLEAEVDGTQYGESVIRWWTEQVVPYLESGEITEVRAEVPVWSISRWYAGSFDLAFKWGPHDEVVNEGWEILDLKTHDPASGFTKPGFGPGYISDVAQIRAYRMAFEEMGLGRTIGQRVVIARDREYRGKCWLEDDREVPERFVELIREAYDHKQTFEKGEVDG